MYVITYLYNACESVSLSMNKYIYIYIYIYKLSIYIMGVCISFIYHGSHNG